MPIKLWDLGLLLAILSIILLSSSLVSTEKSMRARLELVAKIAGLAFLGVASYLMWESLV